MSRKGGTRARDQKTLSHFQDALISTLLSLYRLAPHFGPVALRDTSANK